MVNLVKRVCNPHVANMPLFSSAILYSRIRLQNPAFDYLYLAYYSYIHLNECPMTKLSIFLLLLLAIAGCNVSKTTTAQAEHAKTAIVKEKWHWNNAQKQNESAGYAQVVRVGNTLYISGIPTSDLSSKGVANVYKALGDCLKAFGASSKNVVKETLYTTDIETMKKCNDPRKKFYKGDYPAASWVQVSRLYEPEAKLEVELIAVLLGDEK